MDKNQATAIFWFRRDLRLNDNTALFHALTSGLPVLPVFIFDTGILKDLEVGDKRVSFIYQAIENLNRQLFPYKTSVRVFCGIPGEIFEQLISENHIRAVYTNHDYEPYARDRDKRVSAILAGKGILFETFKDQVIFEKDEITKSSGEPYTVFTPYSRRWLEKLGQNGTVIRTWDSESYLENLLPGDEYPLPSINEIGFSETTGIFRLFSINRTVLGSYDKTRNFPALDSTSRAGIHLRFGTVSIRQLVAEARVINAVWLNELIWREFFMQILWHFPYVVQQPFKLKYQFIKWVNNEVDFEAWCMGLTGYPLVDAGMRELNETGFMHNRVRMVAASFLVKHLLISWQWGEAYFAGKLLDFELSSNNGNWQWAAGTGCDAAPYFRIFNPATQAETFDPENEYIKKWVPEYGSPSYTKPIIDHSFARSRCLETYKASL
ncbi:MAG: deoxyribodipyrimidine photo-lyase [Bacteroidota bacterium]